MAGVVVSLQPNYPGQQLFNGQAVSQTDKITFVSGTNSLTAGLEPRHIVPGGSVNANGSPFDTVVTKTYAGNSGNPTGPGGTANANTAHAVSQYDVACFQQMP